MQSLTLYSFPRAIIHADCDAFFASVEQAINPELKGKPVVTGKERGIAAAMSYEAKNRGVVRGMRLFEVLKVCPDAIILPNDYETYSLFSKRFHGILRRFTPAVEEYSIDEAYADLTGLRRMYHTGYEEIAREIKLTVERELGLTISIGLAPTKSLAKICSNENKPSGFTCVRGHELQDFLPRIPTGRVCGFGPNSVALLYKHGIYTVYDFVMKPETFARKLLGKIGSELWFELRGTAIYKVADTSRAHQASIGKTKTFTPATNDRHFVKAQVLRNLESAFIKLRRHELRAGAISLHMTDNDFHTRGLYAELNRPTASIHEAFEVAVKLFDGVFDPKTRYRRTGVVLNFLEFERETQYDLFEDTLKVKSLREVSRVIDDVNEKYGKHALHLGSTDCLREFNQHLGDRGDVAGRKQELLKGETARRRLAIPVWRIKI